MAGAVFLSGGGGAEDTAPLEAFLDNAGVIYGGSAGAALLGADT